MLTAAVCRSLSLQVGRTKIGESQILFLWLRWDAEWFGLTLSDDAEPRRTLYSSQTPVNIFQNTVSYSTPCWQSHINPTMLQPQILISAFLLIYFSFSSKSVVWQNSLWWWLLSESWPKAKVRHGSKWGLCLIFAALVLKSCSTLGWKLQSSLKDNVLLKTSSLSQNIRGL